MFLAVGLYPAIEQKKFNMDGFKEGNKNFSNYYFIYDACFTFIVHPQGTSCFCR